MERLLWPAVGLITRHIILELLFRCKSEQEDVHNPDSPHTANNIPGDLLLTLVIVLYSILTFLVGVEVNDSKHVRGSSESCDVDTVEEDEKDRKHNEECTAIDISTEHLNISEYIAPSGSGGHYNPEWYDEPVGLETLFEENEETDIEYSSHIFQGDGSPCASDSTCVRDLDISYCDFKQDMGYNSEAKTVSNKLDTFNLASMGNAHDPVPDYLEFDLDMQQDMHYNSKESASNKLDSFFLARMEDIHCLIVDDPNHERSFITMENKQGMLTEYFKQEMEQDTHFPKRTTSNRPFLRKVEKIYGSVTDYNGLYLRMHNINDFLGDNPGSNYDTDDTSDYDDSSTVGYTLELETIDEVENETEIERGEFGNQQHTTEQVLSALDTKLTVPELNDEPALSTLDSEQAFTEQIVPKSNDEHASTLDAKQTILGVPPSPDIEEITLESNTEHESFILFDTEGITLGSQDEQVFPTSNSEQIIISDSEQLPTSSDALDTERVFASSEPNAHISDIDQERLQKKFCGIRELVDTEERFANNMAVVVAIYYKKLHCKGFSECVSQHDMNNLFSNAKQVLLLSQKVVVALRDINSYVFEADMNCTLADVETGVGSVILNLIPEIESTLKTYCYSNTKQMETFYQLRLLPNSKIDCWLSESSQASETFTQSSLTLDALLIEPVQRLMRYPILLDSVIKYTTAHHPDFKDLKLATQLTKRAVERINSNYPSTSAHTKITTTRASYSRAVLDKSMGVRKGITRAIEHSRDSKQIINS